LTKFVEVKVAKNVLWGETERPVKGRKGEGWVARQNSGKGGKKLGCDDAVEKKMKEVPLTMDKLSVVG